MDQVHRDRPNASHALRLHRSQLDADETSRHDDKRDHDGLCQREQEYFLRAIREDPDLTDSMDDAIASIRIAAADESFRTGKTIDI